MKICLGGCGRGLKLTSGVDGQPNQTNAGAYSHQLLRPLLKVNNGFLTRSWSFGVVVDPFPDFPWAQRSPPQSVVGSPPSHETLLPDLSPLSPGPRLKPWMHLLRPRLASFRLLTPTLRPFSTSLASRGLMEAAIREKVRSAPPHSLGAPPLTWRRATDHGFPRARLDQDLERLGGARGAFGHEGAGWEQRRDALHGRGRQRGV